MRSNASQSFADKEISPIQDGGFQTRMLEVQPGLIACVTSAFETPEHADDEPAQGDNEYIHLNCLLSGKYAAKVKDVSLLCEQGHVNMGFSDGEIFHTEHCENLLNLELMISPQLLYELAGEELSGLNFDADLAFFIKSASQCQRGSAAASRVASLIQDGVEHSLLLQSAVLDCLYWQLLALRGDKRHQDTDRLSPREEQQLNVAKSYLLTDLSAPPTIASLAKTVGLNQCKLKKGFKIRYGKSIYAYFQEERMLRAMNLLKNNNVTETAMILGYSNVSHFSSAFRKQFGVVPSVARRDLMPDIAIAMN
ncbi:DNA-binding domain-containing protein, AraC-type [Methylophaga frappieri]|uniref:DNA-binding domain-containing protein, AraC-type n=1 Tax=Methylophaga frappieri (strain ATCC BAA-2434 / DSM 25690 / JAM7) TaxID=754477 RepID=I1YF81_METFJ|nr:AraC family transcriptional regulator [Methylophaga frappieri]AFJ01574.1 DNA-binding domain-containing protein, AraC-type [Methylophaga frappieri]